MNGLMDIGGGMRGAYASGVLDFLLDHGIELDYCLGVSAGSANLITYISKQPGRDFDFYDKYSFRKEYMSIGNWVTKRSFLDLDYIYSYLSNEDGESPLDFDAFESSKTRFVVSGTVADSAETHFFGKEDFHRNDLSVLKASSALPVACHPYAVDGVEYFDGGINDPIPYAKAFEDGCDKIILIATKPAEIDIPRQRRWHLMRPLMIKYPEIWRALGVRHEKYNAEMHELRNMQKEGRALIVSPSELFGIDTIKRTHEGFVALHDEGYVDAQAIDEFLSSN